MRRFKCSRCHAVVDERELHDEVIGAGEDARTTRRREVRYIRRHLRDNNDLCGPCFPVDHYPGGVHRE